MTHVFISYVRENGPEVERIADSLRSRGISVWLDRDSIAPGSRWKIEIRKAITEGGFFVACFSAEYSSRGRTYMNEELTIAIEELRQRPTDRAWFIPVVLSDCEIPDRDIGAGETLRDFQWVELWRDWDSGMRSLLETLLLQGNQVRLSALSGSEQSLEALPRPDLYERLEKAQDSLDDGQSRLSLAFSEGNPHADQMDEVVGDLADELRRLLVEVEKRENLPLDPYDPGNTNDPEKARRLLELLSDRRAPVAEVFESVMAIVFTSNGLSIFTRVNDFSTAEALRQGNNEIVLEEVLTEVLGPGATWKVVTPEAS